MAKSFLVDPDGVKQRLQQRYRANHKQWLEGDGSWPLPIPLGLPNEQQAREQLAVVKAWQARWHDWQGEGEVVWIERRWPSLGTQRLPERVLLHNPAQVAAWLGETERWQRVTLRYALMVKRWPQLAEALSRYFEPLAVYSEGDFQRLFAMLEWLEAHPDSGLFLRQLPVSGVDTKWLAARKSFVAGILSVIRGNSIDRADFHEISGIRREPTLVRLRLLHPEVRRIAGGLEDITAPVEEIAHLALPLRRVYIVENLQTGLAFEEVPAAAVFMRLGYAVDLFGEIPWLKQLPCYYWGDLDTHGFAILNRLRHYLPQAQSLLMGESTLLAHQELWGQEDKPVDGAELSLLTETEQGIYRGLCNHRWGTRVRLEQERIPWTYAWKRLCEIES